MGFILQDPVFSTFMETFPPSDRPDWSSSGTEFARRSLPSPVRPRSSSPINLQPVSPVYTQHSPSQLPSPLRQQQSSSFYPTPIATGIPLTPKLIQSMPPVALALHSGKLPCYENNFSISNCQVKKMVTMDCGGVVRSEGSGFNTACGCDLPDLFLFTL